MAQHVNDKMADADMPPRRTTDEGAPRRVGVELEFGAISARDGAHLVQSLFGGDVNQEDPHRFHVTDTSLGKFTCELDTQYAHGDYDAPPGDGEFVMLTELLSEFRDGLREVYGNISSLVVPCEIVCPPVPLEDLAKLDNMVRALTDAGAQGTRINPLYAFGAQFNPEIATRDTAWLTAMIKAYLLVSDWLRAIMEIDSTRRLTAFAAPFPPVYVTKVVAPDYWPDETTLISDYLQANPTRNRELDLLPLFAWMNDARVKAHVPDHRIKARPTFHYRLPDARIDEAGWSLMLEWRRWLTVERLAENHQALAEMGRAYIANRDRLIPNNWAIKSSEWLALGHGADRSSGCK